MIIPSIDIQNGRAVQLRRGKEFVLDGGDPLERLDDFSIVGEVAVIDLDAAMGAGSNRDVIEEMCRRSPVRVGGGIRSIEDAERWLDAGAKKIILGTAATTEICSTLPRDRVIAAVDADRGEIVTHGWQAKTGEYVLDRIERLAPYVGGFLLTQIEFEGGLGGFDMNLVKQALERAGNARITAAGGIRSAEEIADLDTLGVDAQVGMAIYSGKLSLAECLAACLKKPVNDRFWPTVVSDEFGRSLGLAWSTAESLEAALQNQTGTYWSRSRDSLWEKGATSGNRQDLIRVDLDCDRDALRFTVRQYGGFCHKDTYTCWGDTFGLPELEQILVSRREIPVSESGTSKLMANSKLLDLKLREEIEELIQAPSTLERRHEAADVLYFLLVKTAASGISLESVVDELAKRNARVSRRPMEAKASEVMS